MRSNQAVVITDPNMIELMRWLTIRAGLTLELNGMRHSHNAVFQNAKKITGMKTRKACLKKMNELIRKKKLELTPELDGSTLERLREPIYRTWQVIGCDVEQATQEAGEQLTNYGAIEVTIDANNLQTNGNDKEADVLIGMLCEKHGLDNVMKWLCSNIKLV